MARSVGRLPSQPYVRSRGRSRHAGIAQPTRLPSRPGEFSQAPHRSGREPFKFIRLVSPHQGCRLPLTFWAPPSLTRLAQVNGDDLPPLLHGRYPASSLLPGSRPLSGASVLSASRLSPLYTFSLTITGQVLTSHTKAQLSFAPSTCRMPLGQYHDIPRANPGGRGIPRF